MPAFRTLLYQFNRVDDSAAFDSFAPGREELRGGEGVYPTDLDVLSRDACLLQQPLIGFPEIDMVPAGHRRPIADAVERPDAFYWELCILEVLGNLFANLETVRADGRAEYSEHVAWIAAETLNHHIDGLLGNMEYRAFPSGVNGGYDVFHRIVQQNRNTVGSPDADGHSREIGDESVVTFKFLLV